MRRLYLFAILLINVCLFCSCQKAEIEDTPANFEEVFDVFWNDMNANYLYWDIDSTNWDQIYCTYKPLFTKLDMNRNEDVRKSVSYFREMTRTLIDGHYSMNFKQYAIMDSSVFPAMELKKKRPEFHYPYSYRKTVLNYLDAGYVSGFDYSETIYGQPITVLCGSIRNSVLYFSCNKFSLFKSYSSIKTNPVKNVLQYLFDKLANLPESIKGVVIDVRGNPGGDLGDLNFLVGHFIDKPLHFGYTQYKSGNGRLDYTPWVKAYVNPQTGGKAIKVPIVALADNYSASLSEAVVMAICSLTNGSFVGEKTWGATGPIVNYDIYNAGQFTIPNFLSVQTASCRFKYMNGKIYEGTGFSPKVAVPFNSLALSGGKDVQLEKAIEIIH